MSLDSVPPTTSPAEAKEAERYLTFSLCTEEYAVPLLKVKEVIGLTDITPIPYTPTHFKGIMNLRGQVISVIDLRLKLKLSKAEIKPETAIIILDLHPMSFGVIVDSIDSVLALEADEHRPAPDVDSGVNTDFISGVTKRDKKLVIILNIEKVLSVDDIQAIRRQAKSAA